MRSKVGLAALCTAVLAVGVAPATASPNEKVTL